MKTLLRALILILIVLWLGGVMFFPVVAATAFSSLPDTHAAGTIVGKCLRILHYEGLFAGTFLIVLLLAAHRFRAYTRNIGLPVFFALAMLALTAFSQFWIIPKMENYRIATGALVLLCINDQTGSFQQTTCYIRAHGEECWLGTCARCTDCMNKRTRD